MKVRQNRFLWQRTFFSDIHGHVEPLRRALERINPTESDVFYCLGDMIDRGPSSLATIKTIRELPNCTV